MTSHPNFSFFFFFNDTATTEIYTLSLHDALPISPQWLDALGCERPNETEVKVWFGYASRLYHRSVTPPWRGGVLIFPKPPERRGGALFAIEGDRWICTLGGWLRE